MKNISRRVFIKGMAVAAAATAASTVLTGCKLPVSTDPTEGEDNTPSNVQSLVFVDQEDGKKFTLDVTSVTLYPLSSQIVLGVKATNDLEGNVTLNKAAADGSNAYALAFGAWEATNEDSAVIPAATLTAMNPAPEKNVWNGTTVVNADGEKSGNIGYYLTNNPAFDAWTKLTTTVTLYKYANSKSQAIATAKLVINNV